MLVRERVKTVMVVVADLLCAPWSDARTVRSYTRFRPANDSLKVNSPVLLSSVNVDGALMSS